MARPYIAHLTGPLGHGATVSYYRTYDDITTEDLDLIDGRATIRVAPETYAALEDLSGRYESARAILDNIDESSDDNGDPVYSVRWTEDVADRVALALANDGTDRIPCLDESRTVARAAWETGAANTDVEWEDPTSYEIEQDDGPGTVEGERYRMGTAYVNIRSSAVADAISTIDGSHIENAGDDYWYGTVIVTSADDDDAWYRACNEAFAKTRAEIARDGFYLTH